MISERDLNADDINSLFRFLSSTYDISIDTTHYLQAYQVVNESQNANDSAIPIRRWPSILSPIVCKSSKEQEAFPHYFQEWLNNLDVGTSKSQDNTKNRTTPAAKRRSVFKSLISIFIVLTVIFAGYTLNGSNINIDEANTNTSQEEQGQGEGQEQILLEADNTVLTVLANIASVVLIVFYFLTLIWRNKKKERLWLKQNDNDQEMEDNALFINKNNEQLFTDKASRKRYVKFRERIVKATKEIDGDKTVCNATKNFGLIDPVYKTRNSTPEYLILIDVDNGSEHLTQISTELVNSMREQHIQVTRFYFFTDPRYCFHDTFAEREVSLRTLSGKYASSRLIIISDGSGFVRQRTGKLQPWVTDVFSPWKTRVFLSPLIDKSWGINENSINQAFSLYPIDELGMESLAHFFEAEALAISPKKPQYQNAILNQRSVYPAIIEEDITRWLLHTSPNEEAINQLISELRVYLGEFGFKWLCACAVFPQLVWEITHFLYDWLLASDIESNADSERMVSEQELFYKISQLPWFEQGYIPNYLRVKLTSELSFPQLKEVTEATYALINCALENPESAKQINFGTPIDNQRKHNVDNQFSALPIDDQLKDGLVARVLHGKKPAPTDFLLPEKVSDIVSGKPIRQGLYNIKIKTLLDSQIIAPMMIGIFIFFAFVVFDRFQQLPLILDINQTINPQIWRSLIEPFVMLVLVAIFVWYLTYWFKAISGQQKALDSFYQPTRILQIKVVWPKAILVFICITSAVVFSVQSMFNIDVANAYAADTLTPKRDVFYTLNDFKFYLFFSESASQSIKNALTGWSSLNLLVGIMLIWRILPLSDPRQISAMRNTVDTRMSNFDVSKLFSLLSIIKIAGGMSAIYASIFLIKSTISIDETTLESATNYFSYWLINSFFYLVLFFGFAYLLLANLLTQEALKSTGYFYFKVAIGLFVGLYITLSFANSIFLIYSYLANELFVFLKVINWLVVTLCVSIIPWGILTFGYFTFINKLYALENHSAPHQFIRVLPSLLAGFMLSVLFNVCLSFLLNTTVATFEQSAFNWLVSTLLFMLVLIKANLNLRNDYLKSTFTQRPVLSTLSISVFPFSIIIIVSIFGILISDVNVLDELIREAPYGENDSPDNGINFIRNVFTFLLGSIYVLYMVRILSSISAKRQSLATPTNSKLALKHYCLFFCSLFIIGLDDLAFLPFFDLQILIIPVIAYLGVSKKYLSPQFFLSLYVLSLLNFSYYTFTPFSLTVSVGIDLGLVLVAHILYFVLPQLIEKGAFYRPELPQILFYLFLFVAPFPSSITLSDIDEFYIDFGLYMSLFSAFFVYALGVSRYSPLRVLLLIAYFCAITTFQAIYTSDNYELSPSFLSIGHDNPQWLANAVCLLVVYCAGYVTRLNSSRLMESLPLSRVQVFGNIILGLITLFMICSIWFDGLLFIDVSKQGLSEVDTYEEGIYVGFEYIFAFSILVFSIALLYGMRVAIPCLLTLIGVTLVKVVAHEVYAQGTIDITYYSSLFCLFGILLRKYISQPSKHAEKSEFLDQETSLTADIHINHFSNWVKYLSAYGIVSYVLYASQILVLNSLLKIII